VTIFSFEKPGARPPAYFLARRRFFRGRICWIFLILGQLLSNPQPSQAGSFNVSPVRIFLNASRKTGVLDLVNQGAEKVTIQLKVSGWRQGPEGEDLYDSTKDIVVFPKIFELDRGEKKSLRLGYQEKPPKSMEKTYRLFLQELPIAPGEEKTVRMTLNIGVPIFVAPSKEIRSGAIEKAWLDNGRLKVRILNTGNCHFFIKRLIATVRKKGGEVAFSKEITGWYSLAGASRTYEIELPSELGSDARELHLEAIADDLTFQTKVPIDRLKSPPPAGSDNKGGTPDIVR
jgi:fimbrial chaperone protein